MSYLLIISSFIVGLFVARAIKISLCIHHYGEHGIKKVKGNTLKEWKCIFCGRKEDRPL